MTLATLNSLAVATLFRDFLLEERTVSLLSRMGYRVIRRVVSDTPWSDLGNFEADLIFTDHEMVSGDSVITIDTALRHGSDRDFLRVLHGKLFPQMQARERTEILLVGAERIRGRALELAELLQRSNRGVARLSFVEFREEDLQLALIPTRRRDEVERICAMRDASKALFIFNVDKSEQRVAESFIEYQRRIHRHLDIAFAGITDEKNWRGREGLRRSLHPFEVFPVRSLTLGKIAGVSEKRMVGKISHQKGKHLQIDGIAKWLLSSS